MDIRKLGSAGILKIKQQTNLNIKKMQELLNAVSNDNLNIQIVNPIYRRMGNVQEIVLPNLNKNNPLEVNQQNRIRLRPRFEFINKILIPEDSFKTIFFFF